MLIAPNAFKGSLTAEEVAEVVNRAFTHIDPLFECYSFPVADGGDGTARVLASGLNARKINVNILDPLQRDLIAPIYITDNGTALIELADAAGIRLFSTENLFPMKANTYGVGQLIKAALNHDCYKIIIGVGGSATLDMGAGLLRALGVRFLGKNGVEVIGGAEVLQQIIEVDVSRMDSRLSQVEIQVACDVNNTLLGRYGAARIYGSQKGATPSQIKLIERNHRILNDVVNKTLGKDMSSYPYGGAAGGVSAALKAFCNAKLMPGAELVLDTLNFDSELNICDLVITGEGSIDIQSQFGKAPFVVAQRAHRAGKNVVGIAGSYKNFPQNPFDAVFTIGSSPLSLKEAMQNASQQLSILSIELAKMIKMLSK